MNTVLTCKNGQGVSVSL